MDANAYIKGIIEEDQIFEDDYFVSIAKMNNSL